VRISVLLRYVLQSTAAISLRTSSTAKKLARCRSHWYPATPEENASRLADIAREAPLAECGLFDNLFSGDGIGVRSSARRYRDAASFWEFSMEISL